MATTQYVYDFADIKTVQDKVGANYDAVKGLLGGKGAGLSQMASLGLPVPPGFTITTEACIAYLKTGKWPEGLSKLLFR
jgi:pyruvate,orthophosphate dikinase